MLHDNPAAFDMHSFVSATIWRCILAEQDPIERAAKAEIAFKDGHITKEQAEALGGNS